MPGRASTVLAGAGCCITTSLDPRLPSGRDCLYTPNVHSRRAGSEQAGDESPCQQPHRKRRSSRGPDHGLPGLAGRVGFQRKPRRVPAIVQRLVGERAADVRDADRRHRQAGHARARPGPAPAADRSRPRRTRRPACPAARPAARRHGDESSSAGCQGSSRSGQLADPVGGEGVLGEVVGAQADEVDRGQDVRRAAAPRPAPRPSRRPWGGRARAPDRRRRPPRPRWPPSAPSPTRRPPVALAARAIAASWSSSSSGNAGRAAGRGRPAPGSAPRAGSANASGLSAPASSVRTTTLRPPSAGEHLACRSPPARRPSARPCGRGRGTRCGTGRRPRRRRASTPGTSPAPPMLTSSCTRWPSAVRPGPLTGRGARPRVRPAAARRRRCPRRDGSIRTSPVPPSTASTVSSDRAVAPARRRPPRGCRADLARIAVWLVGPPRSVTMREHLGGVERRGVGRGEVVGDEDERVPGVGHARHRQAEQQGDGPVPDVVEVGDPLGQVAAGASQRRRYSARASLTAGGAAAPLDQVGRRTWPAIGSRAIIAWATSTSAASPPTAALGARGRRRPRPARRLRGRPRASASTTGRFAGGQRGGGANRATGPVGCPRADPEPVQRGCDRTVIVSLRRRGRSRRRGELVERLRRRRRPRRSGRPPRRRGRPGRAPTGCSWRRRARRPSLAMVTVDRLAAGGLDEQARGTGVQADARADGDAALWA